MNISKKNENGTKIRIGCAPPIMKIRERKIEAINATKYVMGICWVIIRDLYLSNSESTCVTTK